MNTIQPHVIVHCAAERFPDKVDTDPQGAYDLNVGVTAHLAEVASKFSTLHPIINGTVLIEKIE